jgi:multidrug efflux pump
MGLVIAAGLSIGTLFTLFVVPAVYMLLGADRRSTASIAGGTISSEPHVAATT